MFGFSLENNLASTSQSGFKPGNSCINQLLFMTHEIFQSFDEGSEVRSVFLDISKAFELLRYGAKDWYLNCGKMVYMVTC